MGIVSIDIDAMDALISDLESTRDSAPSEASSIRHQLEDVRLGTDSVSALAYGAAIWGWLDDRVRDCHRRLALARLIAQQTPEIAGSVVQIDESALSNLSDTEIESLVQELTDLMVTDDLTIDRHDIDQRVLAILGEHAHDPYFAQALAQAVSPAQLDAYLTRVNLFRDAYYLPEDLEAFDRYHDALLNGLGMSYGLASTNTGETAVPGFADSWIEYLGDREPIWGSQARLATVIARGTWSTEFLTGVYDTFVELEGDGGAGSWPAMPPDEVWRPDPDGLGRIPANDPFAGLFEAMQSNPVAVETIFGSGDRTTVSFNGIDYGDVNAELYRFLRYRGGDEYTLNTLIGALSVGIGSAPTEGGHAWQPVLGEDLASIAESIEAEIAYAEANRPPWYSRVGHTVLDIVGMIPVVGEWADGLNGLWYLAEGDHVNAGISFASMVPIGGWFVQGGKWVKRALTRDELAAAARLGDTTTDVARHLPGSRLALDSAAMRNPASFRHDNFLSPGQLRAFDADRAWLKPLVAGRRFDDFMSPSYQYNQLAVRGANGRWVILDSWDPARGLIVSRKLTQLGGPNAVSLGTARRYIDELRTKYPPGSTIQSSRRNRDLGIDGDELTGQLVLEVPPQQGPISPEIVEYARQHNVQIIDINGVNLTSP